MLDRDTGLEQQRAGFRNPRQQRADAGTCRTVAAVAAVDQVDAAVDAEVVQLVVNNPECGAERRAERLGIPCRCLNHRHYASRPELEEENIAVFDQARVDLIVMAGWMRIVTTALIAAYPERLINIHPSLLPSFRGVHAIGQALSAGVTLTGCTVHLVAEEVDAGPILVQVAVPVLEGDDEDSLRQRIQVQEHRILPLAVALAAERLNQLQLGQG